MVFGQIGSGYQIQREGTEEILKVDATSWDFVPSIEDNSVVMAWIIDRLSETPSIARIIFSQRRNYTYDTEQTGILIEIANIYKMLVSQKKNLSLYELSVYKNSYRYIERWREQMQYLLLNLMKYDPIGAYVEVRRFIRDERIKIKHADLSDVELIESYLEILNQIYNLLDNTTLIKLAKDKIAGYKVGEDRGLYSLIFSPALSPDFMFTRLMARHPLDGMEIDVYKFNNSEVYMYDVPGDIKHLYHLTPPEFRLTEDKYDLLDTARNVLAGHKPKEEEFLDPERMRRTFFNIGKDLVRELADRKNVSLNYEELNELASILVRYTVGFGLIEVLLQDKKIQDINVNSPIGQSPVFILHEDYDECLTNIVPSMDDADGWATKFRLLSGRPLDEANPVLDTELSIPGARSRVAIVQKPLNPYGIAFAFRRHRDEPWTYPLFIKNKMMSPLCAGLLSFLIDGSRSMLFAGTRSSGKTSLLGASLLEIMRKYRIISVEDTLELDVDTMRKIGYNIQALKVRSALTKGGTEVPADEGIRTSLRMGDSSLIVGEIRSQEAFALFEAMRIGALANVVAGTIHGDSPYGVFDRVVNDLKVPRTSFKAIDVIVVSNPVKSSDGLHKWRRVMQVTEVRKHWEEDPLREQGFVDIFTYDPKKDSLDVSQDLANGEIEVLKKIAGNVKEWAGDWDAIIDNINLRANIKEKLIDYSDKANMPDLLEADFVVDANDMFHIISDNIKEEVGNLDSKRILFEFDNLLKGKIRERKFHQSG
nr:type II/IV secretion system ATPase subunit [Candidatus Woesearchaeota archaeon]